MTFIQSDKKSFIQYALFIIIGALIIVSFALIFLYNHSVDLEHSVSRAGADLQKLQTQTAELQDKIFTLSSDANLQKLSEERHFVKDKQPRYLEVDSQPALANSVLLP